jgi:ABC-type dipeptide/oligopeptide/nickel transport system permease component
LEFIAPLVVHLKLVIVEDAIVLKGILAKIVAYFSMILSGTFLEGSKIPFGQILWILNNIHNKSVKQMTEELGFNRKTVARYHKIIRDLLEKNNVDLRFDGELEFDEIYVNAGSKWIKKSPI